MPQRPTPQRPLVRLVLAISLDGRLAPPDGGAAQLGGEGDRSALEQALAWADACLVGAGTLRAHQCTCLIRNPQLLEQRRVERRPEQPIAVVVSRSPDFSQDWRFFQQPLQRWLIAPSSPRQGFDRWLPLEASWSEQLETLNGLGVQRLVLLGGAVLAADLLREDVVDELQFSLIPSVLGGQHTWLPLEERGLPAALSQLGAWVLSETRPIGGDELLVHYKRRRS